MSIAPDRHAARAVGVAGGRLAVRSASAADESVAKAWLLALASAASLMVALDALIVSTALAAIGQEFEASIETLEWTVNAYMLSFAVLLMTASALGDSL